MSPVPFPVPVLIRESRLAVQDAAGRSLLVCAWNALQERDAAGNARGPLPYTEEAIRLLDAAHRADPEDVGIVHHLAIAHHARAWDLELGGDPRAEEEWKAALHHWRTVAASAEFWHALAGKLAALDPGADPGLLAGVRRGLMEALLDVHVEFVRHYCEVGEPHRATRHVEIVRQAGIPPAVKRQLINRVFEAMTAAAAEARAAHSHDSALTPVERFLALFPDHLPALRMFAETAADWISSMSYQRWDEIVRLDERCHAKAVALAQHPDLRSDPLAGPALEELALQFALRGHDRGKGVTPDRDLAGEPVAVRDTACRAFDFGVGWARLGYPTSPQESRVRLVFGLCVNGLIRWLYAETLEVLNSSAAEDLRSATGAGLCRRAIALLDEALDAEPGHEIHAKNVSVYRAQLAELEGMQ